MKVEINNSQKELKFEDGHATVDGISFDGHRVLWAFEYKPKTYLKESELSGDQYRKGGSMTIYRNGVSVYSKFCRTPERAFVVMQYILPKLQDFMGWEDIKIGKKLYNHDVPVVIESVGTDGEIIVKTEDGSRIPWAFHIEGEKNGEDKPEDDEWWDTDCVHILSEHLSWFRK